MELNLSNDHQTWQSAMLLQKIHKKLDVTLRVACYAFCKGFYRINKNK